MSETRSKAGFRRNRAVKITLVASVVGKGISMACTFAQVPLALHYLGSEAYGLWVTLFSVVNILNLVDFGIGAGMQHSLAEAHGSEDSRDLGRHFWTGILALSGVGLALLCGGLILIFEISWADELHIVNQALRENTANAVALSLLGFVLGLPFNGVSKLAMAVQKGWLQAGWVAAGSVLSLLFVVLAVTLHMGFLGFTAVTLTAPIVQGLGLFFHVAIRIGWQRLAVFKVKLADTVALARSSFIFAVPQTGIAVLQFLPVLAISTALGAGAVTDFNVLSRLFGPLQHIQVLGLAAVWPAYIEAAVQRDHGWVRATMEKTVLFSLILGGGLVLIGFSSDFLLRLWLGHRFQAPNGALTWAVLLWTLVQMAIQPQVYVLFGLRQLRRLSIALVPGIIATGVSLFLFGYLESAAAMMAIGSLVFAATTIPSVSIAARRGLNRAVEGGHA